MSNSIEFKVKNKVAYITLNRPEVFNSFNREMALSLQSILDDCNANISQFPIILKNDIIAKLIRLSPGDICRITRNNNKSGINYFYRVCK